MQTRPGILVASFTDLLLQDQIPVAELWPQKAAAHRTCPGSLGLCYLPMLLPSQHLSLQVLAVSFLPWGCRTLYLYLAVLVEVIPWISAESNQSRYPIKAE